MASKAEDLMLEVLSRLRELPVIPNVPIAANANEGPIRRAHRTLVPRETAPAVHLIDGRELPGPSKNDCDRDDEYAFTISIFVRSDAGYSAIDPIKLRVMEALASGTPATAYPHSGRLSQDALSYDQEVADEDALRLDMQFTFKFKVGAWGL